MLGGQGEAPSYCEPWICRQILDQHLYSPAMFTILPLQDWLSMDGALRRSNPNEERINVPANSRHYWRYRMHLTVEKLSEQFEFNDTLIAMISASGRSR
jgi:4-alpha-glucanotransferase